jgi:hypothetical protein
MTSFQITTTRQAAAKRGVKMLVYGRAGMGKTTLCATAPAPIIISAEAGLLSLRKHDVPAVEITTLQQVYDVYNWLKLRNGYAAQIKTICLDSLSEIAEKVLVAEKAKTRDPRQAYGGLADEMIDLAKAFRDLPGFHVLVTAKEVADTNTVTGISKMSVQSPGRQVGPALPYLFDEVFYADIGRTPEGQTFHYLRTKPTPQIDAKDRSGALDEFEYPDITAIIAKIERT